MQIIVVHRGLKQAHAINLRRSWLVAAAAGLFLLMAAGSGLLSYLTIRHLQSGSPFGARLSGFGLSGDGEENRDQYVRQNIGALAVKLGHLQAQLARLDVIGERVASMAGIKPADLPKSLPGRGGPLLSDEGALSLHAMTQAVDDTTRLFDQRSDYLNLVESELTLRNVTTKLLPTNQPLLAGFPGSRFGWRVDPFTGQSALHEGVDFHAPIGTPILAAGAGVVVVAGPHPSYGNHVDVDHGGGVITRYAHASRLLVRPGDIVKQGQKLAEVGSTGRSTGAHLHFEVRVAEAAKDPLRYLQTALNGGKRGAPFAGAPALMMAAASTAAPAAGSSSASTSGLSSASATASKLAAAATKPVRQPAGALTTSPALSAAYSADDRASIIPALGQETMPGLIQAVALAPAQASDEPARRSTGARKPCPPGETRTVRRGRPGACVINSVDLAALSRAGHEPDSSGATTPARHDPELPHEDLRQSQRPAVEDLQQDSR